jgi:hypothetical protein
MTNLKQLMLLDVNSNEYDELYVELLEKLENFCVVELSTVEKINSMNEEQLREEKKLTADFLRAFVNRLEE